MYTTRGRIAARQADREDACDEGNRDKYSHLSSEQRFAILQILRDTKIALLTACKRIIMDYGFDM